MSETKQVFTELSLQLVLDLRDVSLVKLHLRVVWR